jgi:two-component sensor histidine kinase
MRKTLFLMSLSFFICSSVIISQTGEIDSLKQVLKQEKDEKTQVDILTDLATKLRGVDNEEGIRHAENAVQKAESNNYEYGLAEGYRSKADILYHQGKYKDAKGIYLKALSLFEKLDNKKRVSRVLNDLGVIHRYLGDSEQALEYCHRALTIDSLLKDTASIAAAYTSIAMILLDKGKADEAVKNLEQVLIIDSLNKDWGYYAQDLSNIATIYQLNYQYNKSLKYALRSYQFTDSIGDVASAYHSSGVIGDIYREIGNYESSLHYLNISLNKAKEYGKASEIGITYGRFQLTYYKMDSIKQSLIYFDSAMLYASPVLEASLLNNVGELYENKLNDFPSALLYYQRAITKSREISNPGLEVNPSFNMGFLNSKKGNYQEAKKYLDRGLRLATELDKAIEPGVLAKISETYFLAKDYKRGHEILQRAYLIQDSLLNDQQKSQAQLLSYEKRIRDLELSEKSHQIAESERKQKEQFYFIAFLAFLALSALIISYIIHNRGKKIKRLNNRLKYLKDEIHHRVKNDFQSIASMIFIQLNQIENTEVKQTLSGVRERIMAMGQIHMLFYKEGDYLKMGLGDYLKKLVEGRAEVLSNEYIKADLEVEININDKLEERISFDEAKQLGVVINEIITNSYKHAFRDNPCPSLSFYANIDSNKQLVIQIKDNGNTERERVKPNGRDTFGLNMINMICQQLEWEIKHSSSEEGTIFKIVIPAKQ